MEESLKGLPKRYRPKASPVELPTPSQPLPSIEELSQEGLFPRPASQPTTLRSSPTAKGRTKESFKARASAAKASRKRKAAAASDSTETEDVPLSQDSFGCYPMEEGGQGGVGIQELEEEGLLDVH